MTAHRVVLDVNILASALASPNGSPTKVVNMGLEQEFVIIRSDHIIETLLRTLEKPYFRSRLDDEDVEKFLVRFVMASKSPDQQSVVRDIAPDAEDDLVLGAAVSANAAFLVTGDHRFRNVGEYCGVRIVTADEFLHKIERT